MNGELKVLLVEDSENDATLLVKELQRVGYECVTSRVMDEEGLREALLKEWDVIICDYKMPHFSGQAALKIIRAVCETPVLIVSGAIGEETAVESLKAGADDYLLKDRLARLGPAVKRALREGTLRRMKRAADQALHESEERYRQLVESSPDGMLIFESGKLVYVNPSGVDLFGAKTPMDLLGRGPSELFRPSDDELVRQRLEHASDGKTALPVEVQVTALSGPGRVVELVARGVMHHGHKAVQVTCRDISLRRQLERELHQNQRMEAVARLAAGVAHDFNNLLTVLIGHLGLVKSSLPQSDPVYADVRHAAAAAERAFTLTHQLLALSRKQTLSLRPLDLNGLISQLHGTIARITREDVQLEMRLSPDLRPARVDSSQIEQALINLASHAKTSMQHGGSLSIQTKNARFTSLSTDKPGDLPPGDYICIEVIDSGVGLSEEAQQQIFEPFVSPSGVVGPGLGLATVYGIIRQHDGYIYCASELGKGSTFTIYLPSEPDRQHAKQGAENSRFQAGGRTILVVEDEDMLRDFAQLVLQRNGFSVITARHGEEAIEICQREDQPIDLIFTDVVMPQMSGPELARELPKCRPNIAVVFTSGYTEALLMEHGIDSSEAHFVSKPYTVQTLLQTITQALKSKEVDEPT